MITSSYFFSINVLNRVQFLYFQLLSKMIKLDGDYLHGQSLSAFCAPRNRVTLDYILLILCACKVDI